MFRQVIRSALILRGLVSEPKKTYTTFVERVTRWGSEENLFVRLTGLGQRTNVPSFRWCQEAFYVWINGALVGYSQGSMEPSELTLPVT